MHKRSITIEEVQAMELTTGNHTLDKFIRSIPNISNQSFEKAIVHGLLEEYDEVLDIYLSYRRMNAHAN